MSTRRNLSDVLDPPSDQIWLPLIDALEKYAWPRGPVSGDFVDNEHRRHFQSLCAGRRLHPYEPLHDDVRWLWDAGVADFLRQLEEGQLEGEGSPRIPYSDKIKIPADTWRAVRRTPTFIDIDWGRSIVFPKLRDGALYGVRVAPATPVDAVSPDRLNGRSRRRNVHDDALLKNRLETVIKNATQSWPNKQKRPAISTMVQELIRQRKAQGYDGETLRKILSGTYEPAKRLGISPDW